MARGEARAARYSSHGWSLALRSFLLSVRGGAGRYGSEGWSLALRPFLLGARGGVGGSSRRSGAVKGDWVAPPLGGECWLPFGAVPCRPLGDSAVRLVGRMGRALCRHDCDSARRPHSGIRGGHCAGGGRASERASERERERESEREGERERGRERERERERGREREFSMGPDMPASPYIYIYLYKRGADRCTFL